MNKYIKTLAIGLMTGASVLTTSCNLDYKPIDNFSASSFWGSQTEFEGFITAISDQFRSANASNVLFNAGELRSGVFEMATIDGSGILNSEPLQNIYDADHPQFSTFGGYYGFIANINELIYRCNNTNVLSDKVKNGLLGMAYGYRAFSYFQMYRMYGGVVLRTEPDVILGNYEATLLYKGRSTAEETLNQIKEDIKTSLDYFAQTDYVYKSSSKDYYWTKAATEMLAGEVYLWSGKVETGDHKANAADVATAATYFNNVISNYGFDLQDDFYSVWTTPHNKESIFSVCYSSENDGVYYKVPLHQLLWARTTGTSYLNYWTNMDQEGWGHVKGVANRFGQWYNKETGKSANIEIWDQCNFGPCRYTYKNSLYYQYDENDSRINMFYPMWNLTQEERDNGINYLDNFDPKDGKHKLAGTFVCKFRPKIPNGSTYYQMVVDMPIYRLAMAYLYAAECANYAGDNAAVVKYINKIRERAYGDKWDEDVYGYKAGDFKANETALMREWDKEFVAEGQRWWNLRRLTTVKGGTQKDHFVFQPEGCLGFGLDTAKNPWMTDINGNLIETNVPVLNGTTQDEHLLLWPLDKGLLGSDAELADQQNPGYTVKPKQ